MKGLLISWVKMHLWILNFRWWVTWESQVWVLIMLIVFTHQKRKKKKKGWLLLYGIHDTQLQGFWSLKWFLKCICAVRSKILKTKTLIKSSYPTQELWPNKRNQITRFEWGNVCFQEPEWVWYLLLLMGILSTTNLCTIKIILNLRNWELHYKIFEW